MNVFHEGDLEVSFTGAISARRFDDASHGLSHCMKAVDFVVELHDRYLYIEFKDPNHPGSRPRDQRRFLQRFRSGKLDEELKAKFRDTFLYEWACGRADKPVYFLVLVALDDQDARLLGPRTTSLKRNLPAGKAHSAPWERSIAHDASVFNISYWNSRLQNFRVTRRSTNRGS